jgi:hypothetical protein
MIDLQNVDLGIVLLYLLKPVQHVGENAIIENLTTVLCREYQMVFAIVYTVTLLPILHPSHVPPKTKERKFRVYFILELTLEVLRLLYKEPVIMMKS